MSPSRKLPRIDFSDAAPFKIDGDYCKLIHLTRDQFAIVDSKNYEYLTQWSWNANFSAHTNSYYARRGERMPGNKTKNYSMHAVINKTPEGMNTDHHNNLTLDNRERNLRDADHVQSSINRKRRIDNSSGFKGVCLRKDTGRWGAYITVIKRKKFLGFFDTAEEAYAAYKMAARKYHGKFTNLGTGVIE